MRILTPILQAVAATAIATAIGFTAGWYLDLPVVHRSTATGACVRVMSTDDRYGCDTLQAWPHLTTWVP